MANLTSARDGALTVALRVHTIINSEAGGGYEPQRHHKRFKLQTVSQLIVPQIGRPDTIEGRA